jgi:2-keto-4-pentenoate hydratase/2-oxohepta-3-ene-1,7-dioic acid hydratase in catechol pathway
LKTANTREGRNKTYTLGESNLRYLYWTPFQQLTHHASAMCGMNTGDLLGTGTVSGSVSGLIHARTLIQSLILRCRLLTAEGTRLSLVVYMKPPRGVISGYI